MSRKFSKKSEQQIRATPEYKKTLKALKDGPKRMIAHDLFCWPDKWMGPAFCRIKRNGQMEDIG